MKINFARHQHDTERTKNRAGSSPWTAVNLLLIFWGRRSLIDQICCSFLHGFAHVSKVGFVHPIFSLCDINVTLGLLSSRGHVIWRDSVSV